MTVEIIDKIMIRYKYPDAEPFVLMPSQRNTDSTIFVADGYARLMHKDYLENYYNEAIHTKTIQHNDN